MEYFIGEDDESLVLTALRRLTESNVMIVAALVEFIAITILVGIVTGVAG